MWKKKFESKNCGSFYILPIYFNFYFNFPLPTITFDITITIRYMMVTDINLQNVVQKVTNIFENISVLGFFDSLTEDNLTEFS